MASASKTSSAEEFRLLVIHFFLFVLVSSLTAVILMINKDAKATSLSVAAIISIALPTVSIALSDWKTPFKELPSKEKWSFRLSLAGILVTGATFLCSADTLFAC